jgi:hypothetical protein
MAILLRDRVIKGRNEMPPLSPGGHTCRCTSTLGCSICQLDIGGSWADGFRRRVKLLDTEDCSVRVSP